MPLNKKYFIALFFFIGISFNFLHSELGLLDFDGYDHGTHDYCEIVKTTTVNPDVTNHSVKLKIEKTPCFHFITEKKELSSFTLFALEQFRTPEKSYRVFINIRTLLI